MFIFVTGLEDKEEEYVIEREKKRLTKNKINCFFFHKN